MKRKYLSRKDWKRIIERKDKQCYIDDLDFKGHIHLLKIKKKSSSFLEIIKIKVEYQ